MKQFKLFCILYTIIAAGLIIVLFVAGIKQANADESDWSGTIYARIGGGIVLQEADLDIYRGADRHYTAHFEGGVKFDNGLKVAYLHRSNYDIGPPFNDDNEYWIDEINISYEIDLWRF